MFIKGNGNIGIGTTAPGEKLVVNKGNLLLIGTGNNNWGLVTLEDPGSSTGKIELTSPSGNPGIIFRSNDPDNYRANIERTNAGLGFGVHAATTNPGADELFIKNNGNVGIGTTNPTQKLDVVGYVKGRSGLCIGNDCRSNWQPTITWYPCLPRSRNEAIGKCSIDPGSEGYNLGVHDVCMVANFKHTNDMNDCLVWKEGNVWKGDGWETKCTWVCFDW